MVTLFANLDNTSPIDLGNLSEDNIETTIAVKYTATFDASGNYVSTSFVLHDLGTGSSINMDYTNAYLDKASEAF